MIEENFPVLCICGSMRFYEMMLRVAQRYTLEGHIVLIPFFVRNTFLIDDRNGIATMLIKMHRHKIRSSHRIIIVNCMLDHLGFLLGITHVGDNTLAEINYANSLNIPVEYLHEQVNLGLGKLYI